MIKDVIIGCLMILICVNSILLYIGDMGEITNELLYEVMRTLQAAQADIRAAQADHTRHILRLREEVNGLRSDGLRRESLQTTMDTRLERIEIRLNLTDAKAHER